MNRTELLQPLRTTDLKSYRPVVWTPTEVANQVADGPWSSNDGQTYVPARSMSAFVSLRQRLKMAIAVFRGQADVLQWEQGQ